MTFKVGKGSHEKRQVHIFRYRHFQAGHSATHQARQPHHCETMPTPTGKLDHLDRCHLVKNIWGTNANSNFILIRTKVSNSIYKPSVSCFPPFTNYHMSLVKTAIVFSKTAHWHMLWTYILWQWEKQVKPSLTFHLYVIKDTAVLHVANLNGNSSKKTAMPWRGIQNLRCTTRLGSGWLSLLCPTRCRWRRWGKTTGPYIQLLNHSTYSKAWFEFAHDILALRTENEFL